MINNINKTTQGDKADIKITPSEIQLTVHKIGGKLTKTVIVKSSDPDLLLAGKWSVEEHRDDPPHAANVHPWIHFKHAKWINNQMTCLISIQTALLEADQVYERELLFSIHPSLPVYRIPITITTPQIQLSDSTLSFYANELGETLMGAVTIENVAPQKISQVKWSVKTHPHDPLNSEQSHPWIFLKPKKLGFVQGCEMRIDTKKLMSRTTYHREIICEIENLPHPFKVQLEIKTASFSINESYKLPYLAFLVTIFAFSLVSLLTIKRGIDLEGLLSGIFGTLLLTIFLFLALLPLDLILKTSKLSKSSQTFKAKTTHSEMQEEDESFKTLGKTRLKFQFQWVIKGLIFLFTYSGIGLLFYGITKASDYLPFNLTLFDFFAILQVMLIGSLFGLSFAFFRSIYRQGFSFLFAGISLFLSMGLGVTLGIGWSIGFDHPSLLLAIKAISLPLLVTLLYYPFKEIFLLLKHYYLEQRHSIRP